MNYQYTNATNPKNASTGTYYQFMEISVRELLIEKGELSEEDIQKAVEAMDSRGSGTRSTSRSTCQGGRSI